MRERISRVAALFMVVLLLPAPDWATCGGGGGGGMGGMRSGGSSGNPGGMGTEQVYQVPWKLMKPEEAPVVGRAGRVLVPVFRARISEIQLAEFALAVIVCDAVRHDGRRRR